MKAVKTYIILFIFALFGFSMQSDLNPQIIVKKHDFFTVDNLGNVFLVRDHEIFKYLANGNYYNRFSNLKFGEITSVDGTNGLRLVLFYKDFQQIVFLDNQLSQKSEPVSLEQMGYEQTELVCVSANNGIWIFNKANNELIRFDENLKKIASTGNLKQILQRDLKPNFMTEHNGYLYLNSPSDGIFVFDIFGTFSKVISVKDLKLFQVNEDIIYFYKDGIFCSYDHKLFDQVCKTFSASNVKQSFFNKTKVYLSNKDTLFAY
ncbi:MAG: hypothetical protein ACK50A_16525 [Sphingobacteriaceae bacterium]